MTINDLPPSYDAATEPGSPQMRAAVSYPIPQPTGVPYAAPEAGKDIKVPAHPATVPAVSPGAGPSVPHMGPTPVYHYVNPVTQEHVASLLPPDHPEMVCLQEGGHVRETHYGILGILAAVFWFPLGVGLCLLDKRVKCRRCGLVIDDGICG